MFFCESWTRRANKLQQPRTELCFQKYILPPAVFFSNSSPFLLLCASVHFCSMFSPCAWPSGRRRFPITRVTLCTTCRAMTGPPFSSEHWHGYIVYTRFYPRDNIILVHTYIIHNRQSPLTGLDWTDSSISLFPPNIVNPLLPPPNTPQPECAIAVQSSVPHSSSRIRKMLNLHSYTVYKYVATKSLLLESIKPFSQRFEILLFVWLALRRLFGVSFLRCIIALLLSRWQIWELGGRARRRFFSGSCLCRFASRLHERKLKCPNWAGY
jgi:hypothetical protein